jgi:hypothetical protein
MACKTKQTGVWEPDVFVGDNEQGGITRHDGQFIQCNDKIFKKFWCVHQDDLEYLIEQCLKVK